MTSQEIRKKFLDFFKERGHTIVPSSPLIPDDPSVLLTTAGMQQFKRYFTGELDPVKDFGSKNTASIQKSFRTSDIDEVGDESHLTFFEMLGNFSFGGYFKDGAIRYAHEFMTSKDWMGLDIDYVSVFEGDSEVPADTESEEVWKSIGITDIRKFGREDNFWGPTGSEGPCGPTTEIYVNSALRRAQGKPPVEVWNIVFNEYYAEPETEGVDPVRSPRQVRSRRLRRLASNGVDTGMGLERLTMVVQKTPTIFETDLFKPLVEFIPPGVEEGTRRILADHIRGVVFLLSDGVRPSNKEAGYVLRRLVRRTLVYEYLNKFSRDVLENIIERVVGDYGEFYKELNLQTALREFVAESERFSKTLARGVRELQRGDSIDAKSAFGLYETYGLPYEIIKELGGLRAQKLSRDDFDEEFKKHQEVSRAGQEKKFGGHGLILNTGELKAADEEELRKVTRLHTATHMLQQALREVLGSEVHQAGSDITAERTRFDFTFSRKLTPDEIKRVEDIVNQKIKEDLPMQFVELPIEEAKKTGALHFFSAKGGSASGGKEKYPDRVKVYYIGKSLDSAWSKEFCGGPHVAHTGEIGGLKIAKEEAVGAGVRRIRGVLTN